MTVKALPERTADALGLLFERKRDTFIDLLVPRLTAMVESGAINYGDELVKLFGVGIDWELVNRDAVRWARKFAARLVKDLLATTKQRVNEEVAAYVDTPGMTMGDLVERLKGKQINQRRAWSIAQTEVTRAYAQGTAISLDRAGVSKRRWNTNNDEIVCPTCSALNGRVIGDGETFGLDVFGDEMTAPPAHPSCRCWLTGVVDEPNG